MVFLRLNIYSVNLCLKKRAEPILAMVVNGKVFGFFLLLNVKLLLLFKLKIKCTSPPMKWVSFRNAAKVYNFDSACQFHTSTR